MRARGGVGHKKDRAAGIVPHTSIDTEAHWTKSGWHGWVYGWKLHLVTTVATVWMPLAADLTPANEVRRVFHALRSRAIETLNEQFKGIFDAHDQVPTKGLTNTRRWAVGAILVYQLTLWYRHEHGLDLRVGVKPFLKAA